MKAQFILATILVSFATAGIIELDHDSEPEEMFSKFEFVVINYFDPLAPEVESLGEFFELAHQ